MISLTLFVCLAATHDACRPERVAFEGSLMTCSLFGQAAAAEWMTAHPKYRLKRFSCGLRPLPSA